MLVEVKNQVFRIALSLMYLHRLLCDKFVRKLAECEKFEAQFNPLHEWNISLFSGFAGDLTNPVLSIWFVLETGKFYVKNNNSLNNIKMNFRD